MQGLRLTERIKALQREYEKNLRNRSNNDNEIYQRDLNTDIEEILKSVLNYVSRILNTRRGSALIDPDFGIPDFTGNGNGISHDKIPEIEREIEKFITRYEPRLHDVEVSFIQQEFESFEMKFNLRAKLIVGDENGFPVAIITELAPNGQVSVHRE